MDKNQIESLQEEASRYALTPSLLKEILYELKKKIVEKKDLITVANKEDIKINKTYSSNYIVSNINDFEREYIS